MRAGAKKFFGEFEMKAQMKFQKILSLLSIIVAAVVFIYALSFFTGNLNSVLHYKSTDVDGLYDGADKFISMGQSFVDALEIICIVLFVVIAVTYIMGCNSRRNYYITNYIAVGAIITMTAFVALFGLIYLFVLMAEYYGGIDWAGMERVQLSYSYKPEFKDKVAQSPVMFIIGIIVFLIVAANCVAWVLNLIWKIKLMRGEKALLAQGFNKEVA